MKVPHSFVCFLDFLFLQLLLCFVVLVLCEQKDILLLIPLFLVAMTSSNSCFPYPFTNTNTHPHYKTQTKSKSFSRQSALHLSPSHGYSFYKFEVFRRAKKKKLTKCDNVDDVDIVFSFCFFLSFVVVYQMSHRQEKPNSSSNNK